MGTWDQIVGRSVEPSAVGAGIRMQLDINIPFTKVLGGLLDQVKAGKMPVDTYYAILEQYEKVIDEFRNVKL